MSEATIESQDESVLQEIWYRMTYVDAGLEELSGLLGDADEFGLSGLCKGLQAMLKNELDNLNRYNADQKAKAAQVVEHPGRTEKRHQQGQHNQMEN